jgi:hypothetical protein
LLEYTPFPSLTRLYDILSSSPKFNINEQTDYEDLGSRVDIVAIALTDIDGYVELEKRDKMFAQASVDVSPSKAVMKVMRPLDQVQQALDIIHNKIGRPFESCPRRVFVLTLFIVDTRAAHLDRSRTKSALQRLSHRVFYQAQVSRRSGVGGGKPRAKITDHFNSSAPNID